MSKNHEEIADALDAVRAALKSACAAGRFMSAVWFVREDGQMECSRTTWKFPSSRMQEARGMLKDMLAAEEIPEDFDPLPLAEFLRTAEHLQTEVQEARSMLNGMMEAAKTPEDANLLPLDEILQTGMQQEEFADETC